MKKAIWITAICVLTVMLFAACSNGADEDIAVNKSETVSSSAGNVSSDETVTESAELSTELAEQNSAGTTERNKYHRRNNSKTTNYHTKAGDYQKADHNPKTCHHQEARNNQEADYYQKEWFEQKRC